jgi:CIC family chloride channel protein
MSDAEPRGSIDAPPPDDDRDHGLLVLALLAGIAGVLIGVVGGAFRLALRWADQARLHAVEWAQGDLWWRGALLVVVAAVLVAIARFIVRLVPEAGGSGVQRVEAHLRGEVPPAPLRVVPAKFVGGLLAIGSGLALGREGPTVQMGASLGAWTASWRGSSAHDVSTLQTSVAGAGLGVAFGAPLGGAMFVFEEVARAFRTRLVVATLVSTATALAVARLMLGGAPVFDVPPLDAGPLLLLVGFAALGVLLGAGGVLYNRLVIAFLDLAERAPSVPPEAKAAAIGAVVMVVALAAPSLVGGGDALNQDVLSSSATIGALAAVLVVRVLLGPLSYAAGTPGGLFAPLLVVGALAGALLAELGGAVGLDLPVTVFAVVGMSTFFAAVVRAPVTGVILISEMTGQTSLMVPMALAAAAAVVTATAMGGRPIYETLRIRMERGTVPTA